MSRPTCKTCVFYVPAEGAGHGHCHAQPPAAQAGWPAVNTTDWCGEHTDPESSPRFKGEDALA